VSAAEITLMSHGRPEETRLALHKLAALAHARGLSMRLDDEESVKHPLRDVPAIDLDAPISMDVALCVALGGDGTILRALRAYAGTGVPVFAVNFGQVGFLATVEPEQLADGFELALAGSLELLSMPAIELILPASRHTALNDVSLHRNVGGRVAELGYRVGGEEVGSVRCDGLVVATPAGSTGYNLANGGPVMAWGVQGMVVSFIAPHSLRARALVIAPDDVLTVHNSSSDLLSVSVDGRPVAEIAAGDTIEARFSDRVATLAQMPGWSFYRRMREKFGRLSR
jgi:NAD+ kinase